MATEFRYPPVLDTDADDAPSDWEVLATGSTTARRLADRAADVVNVKDHGATGDGTTDDTAAIQAALTYAKSIGTSVVIPPGTYITTSPLVVPSYLVVRGGGKFNAGLTRTVIKAGTGFSGQGVFDVSRDASTTTGYGATLEDFAIDVNDRAAVDGIYASNANSGPAQLTLRRLWISGAGRSGVYLDAVWSSVIESVTVDSTATSTGSNFFIGNTGGTGITTTLMNCYAKRVGNNQSGYRVLAGTISFIGNNGIDPGGGATVNWGTFGALIADGDGADKSVYVAFIGNNVEDFTSVGIKIKTGTIAEWMCNSFVAPSSGTVMAVQFGGFSSRGSVWHATNTIATKGASWANAYPIHTNTVPPLLKFGDGGFTGAWYDTGAYASEVPMLMTETGGVALRIRGGWVTSQFDSTSGAVVKRHLSGTASWTPNIANGAVGSTTVTVAGAAVGDTVAVGFTQAVPAGVLLSGAVTSTNTVTVTARNDSGGLWNPAAGTLRADVWQH